jgi:hypothetical protein
MAEKKYISKLLSVLKFVNNWSVKQLALRLVLSFCGPEFKTRIHVRMAGNSLRWWLAFIRFYVAYFTIPASHISNCGIYFVVDTTSFYNLYST